MAWRWRRENGCVKLPALIGLLAVLIGGCASSGGALNREVPVGSGLAEIQVPPEYRILPGDQLDIKFFFNPELNETALVRPDGKISLQLIDDVPAAGLTPAQLDTTLTRLYAQELKRPAVTVMVRSFTSQRIYVGGEVATPSLLTLTAGMTALHAVFNAGGFKDSAKPGGVIVIRKGPDNRPIPLRVDLQRVLDGEVTAEDLRLQPYDIVYVPKTWIAKANQFVHEYIERLLLFRGTTVGLGFTYDLNPAPYRN
jgi:protein involved in polysaccharide export with SLBB domain